MHCIAKKRPEATITHFSIDAIDEEVATSKKLEMAMLRKKSIAAINLTPTATISTTDFSHTIFESRIHIHTYVHTIIPYDHMLGPPSGIAHLEHFTMSCFCF